MATNKPYVEGGTTYTQDDKGKYKNGVLVPESNYKYLPTQIGGTRGVVDAPVDTGTDTAYTGPTFDEPVYGNLTNDALGKLQGMIDKPWDPESVMDSTQYKALRQEYNIAGQESFQNTLGELSSMTGGRPSSAAVGSAATAMNRYNQQFAANVLPGLTEQSYNQYQKGISNQADLYNILANKDLSEYDRKFQVAEWEWNNSEGNPTVKAQLIANQINQFKADNQQEEYDLFIRGEEARVSQAEVLAQYAPEQAEADLNATYANIANINSTIASRQAADERASKKEAESIPMNAAQQAWYNEQVANLKSLDDPNQAMRWIGMNEKLITDKAGSAGLKQLQDEVQNYIENPLKVETVETEPVYGISEVKSSVDDMLAKIGTEKTAATIDNNGVRTPATTYTRAEIVPGILQTLKSMVERGQITGEQADTIASIRGITAKEIDSFANPNRLDTTNIPTIKGLIK